MSDSILEKLSYEEGRILDLEISEDKSYVELSEACDSFFSVKLDKSSFGELIDELKVIHSQMEE